jgi:heptosyltransferase-3
MHRLGGVEKREQMTPDDFPLPQRPKILVIILRRLGDVLMATPLLRTLRQGRPGATLDVLVFAGSERILKGNPDIDGVLTMPQRPSLGQTLDLLRRLWRRYDLAISTQTGDRPTFFAAAAGRRRVGLVPRTGGGAWWKKRVYDRPVTTDYDVHRVAELLSLANALGLRLCTDIVCPEGSSAEAIAPCMPYAVLHANPFDACKRWTAAGWRDLTRGLADRGLAIVVTEGRDPDERAYVDGIWGSADPPVVREYGQLDWAGMTALLKGAAVYVGPDTSVTHLAAGSGCSTVALYGPTTPRLVGPWPVGGVAAPWADAGTIQHRGNVWVVQNPLPCLPCNKLGCDGHRASRSQCLDELPARQVLAAVDQALAARKMSSPLASSA